MELIGLLLVFSFLSMVIGTVAKGVIRLVGFGVLAALLLMAVGSLDSNVLPNMINSARDFVARVQQEIAGGGGGGQQDPYNSTQADPFYFENTPPGQSPAIPNQPFSNPQSPNQPFNDPNAPLNRPAQPNDRRPITALW
ncbi:MAG: hypothetical protein HC881_00730 [Leptolyngbyaceae cyanobacterium SL_7_1]|nr:hypothetical protein [Leptolyngbyaceae cyanobacterium SL_7_1]